MADLVKIEGFDALNKKLKRLPDTVKRAEILKIQRRLAVPVVAAYKTALPVGKRSHTRYTKGGGQIIYDPGNLAGSVKAVTVARRFTGGNPSLVVRPDKKGLSDGYYRFMVVKKGFKGSGRGSRVGANTVVPQARDRALATTGALAIKEAEIKTARYIQKRITRLGVK